MSHAGGNAHTYLKGNRKTAINSVQHNLYKYERRKVFAFGTMEAQLHALTSEFF
jgi:hypothetical protein